MADVGLLARAKEYTDASHAQKVLYSTVALMNAYQNIDMSKFPISAQPNGIILVFSQYTVKGAFNKNVVLYHIPKGLFSLLNDEITIMVSCNGVSWSDDDTTYNAYNAYKYLTVTDKSIKGNAKNEQNGVVVGGVTYNNSNVVLRGVLSY